MAHSDETPEAVAEPSTLSMEDAAAVFEDDDDFDAGEDDASEEEEFTEDDLEGDEPEDEAEEDEADEEGEPETAIAAPASFNAEEKALFASLTPEQQTGFAAIEARRNGQVQEATTKASHAQREAEARAAAADAEAKQVYAAQLDQVFGSIAPEAPDPQLAYTDPQRYVALKAQYDAEKAQHDEVVQRVQSIGAEADEEAQKAFIEQRDRELMQIPEIANEETRKGYLDKAFSMARELGYDEAELAEGISARDVKALASVADWKDKAAKYDAINSRKMQRVRAGKQRTLKPGGAQPERSTNRAEAKAFANFKSNPRNMAAAAAVFND